MIYFVLPVFNESLNVKGLRAELPTALPGEECFYVFSDDGSSDGTPELLREEFKDFNVIVLGDGVNRGPGFAFNRGFEWVLEHSKSEKDIVATVEADCTSDITILPTMVGISRLGFDMVLASVYAQGGGLEKSNFIRKLLSSCANLMFRFLFNIKVLTISSFYRVYSVSVLRKIKEKHGNLITEAGFICMLEILHRAIRVNAKVIEVPTTLHSSKRKGKSKMKVISTLFKYLKYLVKNF